MYIDGLRGAFFVGCELEKSSFILFPERGWITRLPREFCVGVFPPGISVFGLWRILTISSICISSLRSQNANQPSTITQLRRKEDNYKRSSLRTLDFPTFIYIRSGGDIFMI